MCCDRIHFIAGHTEAFARNAGIHAARHPLIVQLDPDIVFGNPAALRWIARWFEVAEHAVVTVSRNYIQSNGVHPGEVKSGRFPKIATGENDARRCSVYIPVRNGAKYLDEAINSALNQTHKDLEVVVVDDGSTDATPKILDRRSRADARLRWRRTRPAGCSSASNTAIGIAK